MGYTSSKLDTRGGPLLDTVIAMVDLYLIKTASPAGLSHESHEPGGRPQLNGLSWTESPEHHQVTQEMNTSKQKWVRLGGV